MALMTNACPFVLEIMNSGEFNIDRFRQHVQGCSVCQLILFMVTEDLKAALQVEEEGIEDLET